MAPTEGLLLGRALPVRCVALGRQVIKLMRKHGLLEPEPSGRRRGAPGLGASQARGGEGEEEEEGGDTAAQEERGGLAGAAAAALQLAGSSRAARDPDGDQVLACLAAMDAVTGETRIPHAKSSFRTCSAVQR